MTIECEEAVDTTPRGTVEYEVATDEAVSMAVVHAVASASGRSATGTDGVTVTTALDPLAETIDPEALDRLFESVDPTTTDPTTVEFEYGGRQVTVTGTDAVIVTVE